MAEYNDTDTSTEEAVKEAVRKARAEAEAAESSEGAEIPIEDGDAEDQTKADAAQKSAEGGQDESGKTEDHKKEDSKSAEPEEKAPDTKSDTDKEQTDTKDDKDAKDSKESDQKNSGDSKKFFKKKHDPKDDKIAELTDRVQRQMAEFDNFRKRTDREKSASFENGEGAVLEKVLPIVDNFERGLAAVPEEQKDDPFVEGMDKVYKQLVKTLTDLGVEPIEAVGKEFDPNLHNAVMHIDDENYGENIVAEEFQKGYKFHDTVLRHSMVKVAN